MANILISILPPEQDVEVDDIQYRWRCFEIKRSNIKWSGSTQQGCLADLQLAAENRSATLVLPGREVIVRRLSFEMPEKRHLARLIPFELEAELAADVSTLHVAQGGVQDTQVALAYTERKWLQQHINSLEAAGIEVAHCYQETQLLSVPEGSCRIHLEDGYLHLRYGSDQALSIDAEMAPQVLTAWQQEVVSAADASVLLSAPDQAGLDVLCELLLRQEGWQDRVDTAQAQQARLWTLLRPAGAELTDLRQGCMAAPLRWQRYWRPWKAPMLAAVLAVLVFMLGAFIEIQLNKQQLAVLEGEIESVYRSVAPEGVLVDAEQQLANRLNQLTGAQGQAGLIQLMAVVAPHVQTAAADAREGIQLHRLGYSADQNELQLSVSAISNTRILALGESLNSAGLQARTQNISQSGGRQQASLLVSGAR